MRMYSTIAIATLAASLALVARPAPADDRPASEGPGVDRAAAGTANGGSRVDEAQRQKNGGQAVDRKKNERQPVDRAANGGVAVDRQAGHRGEFANSFDAAGGTGGERGGRGGGGGGNGGGGGGGGRK
jgi:hypothetical protein